MHTTPTNITVRNQRTVTEIRQIIEHAEHAQYFDAAAQKMGAAQGRDKTSKLSAIREWIC